MSKLNTEAANIKLVLNSFQARSSSSLPEGAMLTYVSKNAVYTINSKGEKHKVKDVEKNIKLKKRHFKIYGNKTSTDICGA